MVVLDGQRREAHAVAGRGRRAPRPRATHAWSRHDAGRIGGSQARPARRLDPRVQRRGLIWHREAPGSFTPVAGWGAEPAVAFACRARVAHGFARPPELASMQTSQNGGEPGRGAFSATTRAPPNRVCVPHRAIGATPWAFSRLNGTISSVRSTPGSCSATLSPPAAPDQFYNVTTVFPPALSATGRKTWYVQTGGVPGWHTFTGPSDTNPSSDCAPRPRVLLRAARGLSQPGDAFDQQWYDAGAPSVELPDDASATLPMNFQHTLELALQRHDLHAGGQPSERHHAVEGLTRRRRGATRTPGSVSTSARPVGLRATRAAVP